MKPPKTKWILPLEQASTSILRCCGSTYDLGKVQRKMRGTKTSYTAYSYIIDGVGEFDTIQEARRWVEEIVKSEFAKLKEAV